MYSWKLIMSFYISNNNKIIVIIDQFAASIIEESIDVDLLSVSISIKRTEVDVIFVSVTHPTSWYVDMNAKLFCP